MNTKRSTKSALISSLLILTLCVSMMVGTTYAWFTDTVTSGSNKIVAGTLDVQLLMKTDSAGDYVDISDNANPIFGTGSIAQNSNSETLWEPGKTQVAYLAIKNNGSLDLKYSVDLNVVNMKKDLYEAMEYAITPDAQFGGVTAWAGNGTDVTVGDQTVATDVSLTHGATHYFALSIHMKEDAGNEYQGGEVNFDLTVKATQLASETDSFNNQYDKDATYLALPKAKVEPIPENQLPTFTTITDIGGIAEERTLDVGYVFSAPETLTEAQNSPFRYWLADFVVSFDNNVEAGTAGLAGQYDAYQNGAWIGFHIPDMDDQDGVDGIKAGTQVGLLEVAGIPVNYEELCGFVQKLSCGAFDVNGANIGTTMTVELRLYETYTEEECEEIFGYKSKNEKTGHYEVVGKYTYTF